MTDRIFDTDKLWQLAQPPVQDAQVQRARGDLLRFRIMAFVTGIVLLSGVIGLIVEGVGPDLEPGIGYLWVAHGYLFIVYVIVVAILGVRMRWPLPRYLIVMVCGTIPTMSFVAEHFVTKATRAAAVPDAADTPV